MSRVCVCVGGGGGREGGEGGGAPIHTKGSRSWRTLQTNDLSLRLSISVPICPPVHVLTFLYYL